MTKQEKIVIMRKAIKETENRSGQKWSVDKDGNLHWEYLTSEYFAIRVEEGGADDRLVFVDYFNSYGVETFTCVWVGNDFYHDCGTIEDAIYKVVARTIIKANNTF